MRKQRKLFVEKDLILSIFVIFFLLLITTFGGTAWWTQQVELSAQIEEKSPLVRLRVLEESPQIYWLQVVGDDIYLAANTASYKPAESSEVILRQAIEDLLKGPNNSDLMTTIPRQTRLLDLEVRSEGIYLDLSREFREGGGTTSMVYRVAQILYTITSLAPEAKVYLSVEGQYLNENNPLGGEGLILRYPLTRQEFAQEFLL